MKKSADKLKGILIRSSDGSYFFRVADKDGEFQDYELLHNDLSIIIDDFDAFLYEYNDNEKYLDHSPETLGYSGDKNWGWENDI